MKAQGPSGWRLVRGRRYMQVRAGGGERFSVVLSGPATDEEADERAELVQEVAAALSQAGLPDKVKVVGDRIGRATTAREIDLAKRAADKMIAAGKVAPRGLTFKDFGGRWTSGELHKQFPDWVKDIDHKDNIGRLHKHVNPIIGKVPMATFTLEDAELVMRRLDPALSSASRRQVAQVIYRLARLAVYPVKLLKVNPLPVGFLPKIGPDKARPYLYPEEDAKLLGFTEIPLERRLVYGILAREGMRSSELVGREEEKNRPGVAPLPWRAVDRERGQLTLDVNKTDDPRAWVLDPGVARALRAWHAMQGKPALTKPIFSTQPKLAALLREDLDRAGVKRPELHERSASRAWMKAHHLRATFVTLSLANGRTETWVQDRTGHRSTLMIARYRRAARTAAQLELGPLAPLDRVIPEIRDWRGAPGETCGETSATETTEQSGRTG